MLIIVILFLLLIILFMQLWSGGDENTKTPGGLDQYYKYLAKIPGIVNQPPMVKLSDIPESMDYIPGFRGKFGVHIGQRKLFLNEVQYLTEVSKQFKPASPGEYIYVIYAGAAAGHHDWILAKLFPKIKFILVDPNMFDIRVESVPHKLIYNRLISYLYSGYTDDQRLKRLNENTRILNLANNKTTKISYDPLFNKMDTPEITKEVLLKMIDFIKKTPPNLYLIEDLFTEIMAETFRELGNVHFISDIRTNSGIAGPGVDEESVPGDIDVLWNLAQQYVWTNMLNCNSFMLKFRCPFDYKHIEFDKIESWMKTAFNIAKTMGIDFISDYNSGILNYYSGDIFLQPWAPKSSTESRLINFIKPFEIKIKSYNPKEYENKFMYYNSIVRGLTHCENKYANRTIGFDCCQDCALESIIWKDYSDYSLKENKFELHVLTAVQGTCVSLQRDLFIRGHGKLFSPNLSELKHKIESIGISKNIDFNNIANIEIKDYPREKENLSSEKILRMLVPVFYEKDKNYEELYLNELKKVFEQLTPREPIEYLSEIELPPGDYAVSKKYNPNITNIKLMILTTMMRCIKKSVSNLFIIPNFSEINIGFIKDILTKCIFLQFQHKSNVDMILDSFDNMPEAPGVYYYSCEFDPKIHLNIIKSNYIYYDVCFSSKILLVLEYYNRMANIYNFLIKYKPVCYTYEARFYSVSLPPGTPGRHPDADTTIKDTMNSNLVKSAIDNGMKWNEHLSYIPGDPQFLITPYTYKGSTNIIVIGSASNITPGTCVKYDFQTSLKYTYYLSIIRPYYYFINKYSDKIPGFDNCSDCSLIYKILSNFYKNTDNIPFEKIFEICDINLNTPSHGKLLELPTEKKIYEIYDLSSPTIGFFL